MKKLILLSVLCCAIIFANAQTAKTATNNKATTEQKSNKTKVEIKDLLKPITDNITKDYADYKILEAYKIVEKEVVSYEVVIGKGTTKEKLFYDKDGKFVRKGTAPVKTAPVKTETPKK
jgi:sortase (surface protein transpeptidase)